MLALPMDDKLDRVCSHSGESFPPLSPKNPSWCHHPQRCPRNMVIWYWKMWFSGLIVGLGELNVLPSSVTPWFCGVSKFGVWNSREKERPQSHFLLEDGGRNATNIGLVSHSGFLIISKTTSNALQGQTNGPWSSVLILMIARHPIHGEQEILIPIKWLWMSGPGGVNCYQGQLRAICAMFDIWALAMAPGNSDQAELSISSDSIGNSNTDVWTCIFMILLRRI